jgi:hypothetical protein
MPNELYLAFADAYRRYAVDAPVRVDVSTPADHLPVSLRYLLAHSPADVICIGGATIAGSNRELTRWREHEDEEAAVLYFGYSEEGGGYLALDLSSNPADPIVIVIDHETSDHRNIGTFAELLGSYLAEMQRVLEQEA